MNVKRALVGAGAVVAADIGGPYLPASIDVGGLPLRKVLASAAAVLAAGYVLGGSKSFKHSLIFGAASFVAAEVAGKVLPDFRVGGFSVTRVGAGAVGAWGASKFAGGGA